VQKIGEQCGTRRGEKGVCSLLPSSLSFLYFAPPFFLAASQLTEHLEEAKINPETVLLWMEDKNE